MRPPGIAGVRVCVAARSKPGPKQAWAFPWSAKARSCSFSKLAWVRLRGGSTRPPGSGFDVSGDHRMPADLASSSVVKNPACPSRTLQSARRSPIEQS